MAIILEDEHPGKVNAADANYPQGSNRDITSPGDGTGTPRTARGQNDIQGLLQKLLDVAGITPSGSPDTILASDYFDGLVTLLSRPALTIAVMTAITGVKAGNVFNVAERSTGNRGGGIWVAVVTGTTPLVDQPDTFGIVVGVADSLISFVRRVELINDIRALGAVGDGSTDDTGAIQYSLDNFTVVFASEGNYSIADKLNFKSKQTFFGPGEELTTITWDRVANTDNSLDVMSIAGTVGVPITDVHFYGMTIDANKGAGSSPGSGPRGTGVGVRNGTNILIENMKCIDAPLHCFDVSSLEWNGNITGTQDGGTGSTTVMEDTGKNFTVNKHIGAVIRNTTDGDSKGIILSNTATTITSVALAEGNNNFWTDGDDYVLSNQTQQPDRSSNVTLRNIEASGAGDDNVTTHFSDNITIDIVRSIDPSGTHTANSNCIEIDDGSTRVNVSNFYCKGGNKGLEIKGHEYAPAPAYVNVDNGIIEECSRGIHVSHGGHNSGGEVLSTTATTVNINNIQIINPAPTASVVSSGMLIQSYINVNVNNITVINDTGNPSNVQNANPVVSVGGRAKNVNITDIDISGFDTAQCGIKVSNAGGADTKFVKVSNAHVDAADTACYIIDGNCKFINLLGISGENSPIGLLTDKNNFVGYPLSVQGLMFDSTVTVPIDANGVDKSDRDTTSRLDLETLYLRSLPELTISSGAITVGDSSRITVDTEGNAASDDLVNINVPDVANSNKGYFLILNAENAARTVVVKNGTGNILLGNTGADISLDNKDKTLTLIFDTGQSKWLEI